MSKKDEKDINISKLDKSLEGQGLLEDADDAEYERTLAQQRREAEERERQVLEQAEAERREQPGAHDEADLRWDAGCGAGGR